MNGAYAPTGRCQWVAADVGLGPGSARERFVVDRAQLGTVGPGVALELQHRRGASGVTAVVAGDWSVMSCSILWSNHIGEAGGSVRAGHNSQTTLAASVPPTWAQLCSPRRRRQQDWSTAGLLRRTGTTPRRGRPRGGVRRTGG